MRFLRRTQQPDAQEPEQTAAVQEPEEEPDVEAEIRADVLWDGDLEAEARWRAREMSDKLGAPSFVYYSDALRKAAAERGVPKDVLSRRLAEANAQLAEYYDFLEGRGLDQHRPDARQAARDVLTAIERRRSGIELRMKNQNLRPGERERMQAELDQLEEAEGRAWSSLHPAVVAGEELSVDEATCRGCGRGMSREKRWNQGRCDVCVNDFQTRTGAHWRALIA
jgi:hypothetical protein